MTHYSPDDLAGFREDALHAAAYNAEAEADTLDAAIEELSHLISFACLHSERPAVRSELESLIEWMQSARPGTVGKVSMWDSLELEEKEIDRHAH